MMSGRFVYLNNAARLRACLFDLFINAFDGGCCEKKCDMHLKMARRRAFECGKASKSRHRQVLCGFAMGINKESEAWLLYVFKTAACRRNGRQSAALVRWINMLQKKSSDRSLMRIHF